MTNTDDLISKYIHVSKYARWIDEEGRRETWDESVNRLGNFWVSRTPEALHEEIWEAVEAVRRYEVMPSMRTMWTAGEALDRDNVAGYNCAGIAINHTRCFDEIFYLLMCGCGVGFSVERQYTNELPLISEDFYDTDTTIDVADSKIGWAKALKELITLLYNGQIPLWDLSSIRSAGERLKTFGGRASGPEPLDELFRFVVSLFTRAAGRRLNSIECHDTVCKIADTVIVGSVRRSATLSLGNLSDDRHARAKRGEWYLTAPYRALANNSVAYTEKPDMESYLKEWRNIYESKAGERGIVNKITLKDKAIMSGREYDGDYILNPCGEAILRDSGGLCNLTEVIVRSDDNLESLSKKVKYATILGTLQSTLTDFRYLRKVWKDNAEEERLLGVSLTGIMDHEHLSGSKPYWNVVPREIMMNTQERVDFYSQFNTGVMRIGDKSCEDYTMCLEDTLSFLKDISLKVNNEWSNYLDIPESSQLTLVKPSGTVSQLCNTSSGMHPRFSQYYLRRFTQDNKDPLTSFMIEQGIPYVRRGDKSIFSIPVASPEGAIYTRDIGAIQQLDLWKIYRDSWCDGNPSQTIYYTDDEFCEIQAWVWKNWDYIGGLSFFPLDDNIYDREIQPYLEISKEEYEEFMFNFSTNIDWDNLRLYENNDNTQGAQELACAGGACEL